MKNKIIGYILSGVFFLLMSCAEEGPFESGKLECEISVLNVSSTIAYLKVNIPQNKENDMQYFYANGYSEVFLIPESIMQSIKSTEDRMKYAVRGRGSGGSDVKQANIFFSGLTPNSKYYVVIDTDINPNGYDSGDNFNCLYFTDYTVTTNSAEAISVETQSVTPFSAKLKVSFPKEEIQFLERRSVRLFLSDKPFGPQTNYTYEGVYDNNAYIWGPWDDRDTYEVVSDYEFSIYRLNPDTKYYIGVLEEKRYKYEYVGNYNDIRSVYITDQSFTTGNVGDIDKISVEEKWIIPNEVMIKVSYAASQNNDVYGAQIFLSDKPFEDYSDHSYESLIQNSDGYSWSHEFNLYNLQEKSESVISYLNPETKYYIGVVYKGYYPEDWGGRVFTYVDYTDQTITTPASGDYSDLVTFEFLGNRGEKTYAKLCFPEYFSYAGNTSLTSVVSLNSDFSDSIQGDWEGEGYIREYYNLKSNEVPFNFPKLEHGKYYVKFEGTLIMNYKDDFYNYNDYHNRMFLDDFKIEGPVEYGD